MAPAEDIRPFTIAVPDAALDDLRRRLDHTRWPEAETVDDWSQGIPLAYLQDVCRYWATDYDWRERETRLNRFDQFVTEIDGLDIHFIHARSPDPAALPLLLSHGWPGSVVEFHKVIEPLTETFHVVAPSLPGFGFSGKPDAPGWGVDRIASAFAALMARLGYSRYVAQGGDWGSAVTAAIGALDAEHCAAIHLTMAMGAGPPAGEAPSPEATRAIERALHYREWDSGYFKQQATRPQTVGYGLVDSPAALAGWILEKFWSWTDCDGHPENILTRDELLDNVMVYWVTGTGASSARLYWESARRPPSHTVEVPTGFGVYPEEIVPPVREWVDESFPNVVHWATQERGGHFAALEVPDVFVEDLRTCFR